MRDAQDVFNRMKEALEEIEERNDMFTGTIAADALDAVRKWERENADACIAEDGAVSKIWD